MIKNYVRVESKLEKIEKSPIEFHLTGSKFFLGTGNDIDLFTKDCDSTRRFLESIGFKLHSSSQYKDDSCISVYRAMEDGRNAQIDIQLVINVDLKIKVQEKLKQLGILSPTTEQWNLAFAFMLEKKETV